VISNLKRQIYKTLRSILLLQLFSENIILKLRKKHVIESSGNALNASGFEVVVYLGTI
jgi:hypothetical protein